MKKLSYLLAILLLVTGITILLTHKSEEKTEQKTELSKLDEKNRPSEYFHFMRSYPDESFSVEGYNQAMEEAINFRASQLASRSSNSLNSDWKLEGPTNIGGRFNAMAVHPNDNNIIFAASAAGGIFKSINGGSSWTPITENLSYLAVSDITIDENHPDTMFIATGDHNISGIPHIGNGIYKTTDGGITWSQSGLSSSNIISRVIIDPTNSNIIYAAAMGNPFAADSNRGVYKSIDGGSTWTQSKFFSTEAGAIELVMDPFNSGTLYCSGWERIRTNQRSLINGNSARIWKTTNGGATWSLAHSGIPTTKLSRIGISHSQLMPNLLVASVIDTTQNLNGIYKSTNGGASWTILPTTGITNVGDMFRSFGWYFGQIRINPFNDNEISVLGIDLYTSNNGGNTWRMSTPVWSTYQVHADKHDMIYLSNNTALLATDGGLYKTTDGTATWTDIETTPTTQLYRVTVNPLSAPSNRIYTGGAQDNGTMSGNSSSLNTWIRDFGGDGFKAYFDDVNFTRYFETQNGNIYAIDGGNTLLLNNGFNPADRKNWDMPYLMSHYDNTTLYAGTEKMYRMNFAPYGQWDSISPDLTDGNIFGRGSHTISSIDESAIDADYLYAGTSDGNVWYTSNGGTLWNDITSGLPDRYVTSVNSSWKNTTDVYVSHSGYKYNETIPHIHKSTNNGGTWNNISGNLPNIGINDICLYENVDSVVFVATDDGVYVTLNDGVSWDRIGGNMPIIPVFDLEIDYDGKKLIAGTFARSIQSFPLDSVIMVRGNNSSLNEKEDIQFKFYPNPVHNIATLSNAKIGSAYTILDAKGTLVKQGTVEDMNQQLNVSELTEGLYFITIEGKAVRFLKQ